MLYSEIAQNIINYIEDRLHEEIELNELAKESSFSLMQVYRIFSTITGMTPKDYIRGRRLTKALFDVKYLKDPILDIALKYGYSTHEAFSRAFRKYFGILPSEYRKKQESAVPMYKYDVPVALIHKASHEAADSCYYDNKKIDLFFADKAALKLAGWVNKDKMLPSDFYDYCILNGIENRFAIVKDALFCCGACLNKPKPYDMHMFCMALPYDYNGTLPDDFEVFDVQASRYAVFSHGPYSPEEHGGVISSVRSMVSSFRPEAYGYEFNMSDAPILETDNELGYFLHLPVRKASK
ncbi:MAG: helix-turn-helix domain-containing protein [Bacillota bacterium]